MQGHWFQETFWCLSTTVSQDTGDFRDSPELLVLWRLFCESSELSWKESYDKPRQCIKKQGHHFANKDQYSQSYGLSSSHVQMWELENKEGRVLRNWCFQTVVLEKTLESLLDSKEIKPVNAKGSQLWILFGRTNAEAPILWPPDVNSQLTGKDPDAGKDWGQDEKGVREDEMVGWQHQLNGHEFWANSGSSWWTGRPGVLPFMGSQRVGDGWATELNWTERKLAHKHQKYYTQIPKHE